MNDIRVDESADSKASGDVAQNIEEKQHRSSGHRNGKRLYPETNVRQEGVDEGIQPKQMEHTFTC